MEGIIIALITGLCAIVGQWIISRNASRQNDLKRATEAQKRAVEQAVKDTEMKALLKSIEAKLEEHNGYAEKFSQMTGRIEEIEKAVVGIQKEIEFLRKGE